MSQQDGNGRDQDAAAALAAAGRFVLPGRVRMAQRYGSGHIHGTYLVACDDGPSCRRFILQRINRHVFKDVPLLMDNLLRITRHLQWAATLVPAASLPHALQLMPTRDGAYVMTSPTGEAWRMFAFVEDTETFDICPGPDQAYAAARAFGLFQRQLLAFPLDSLREPIRDFHHAPKRFDAFEQACRLDVAGRVAQVEDDISFCRERRDRAVCLTRALADGRLPWRVTHNDPKFNNVLLDCVSGQGMCVIDLDTVMPGTVLYDFGDMVRSFTATAAEDETDLDRVAVDLKVYEGLAEGYAGVARAFLTDAERAWLGRSGQVMTLIIGLRFLTDFLSGDPYFHVAHPRQNLDRARVQFKLVREQERRERELAERLRRAFGAAAGSVTTRV